jgi:7-cyano-7-deazaguanine synthase
MTTSVVPIVSGGLDSITLLHKLRKEAYDIPLVLSFDYGQRHSKELAYAASAAKTFSIEHRVIDLSNLASLLAPSGSSLISDNPVPEGHYAEDNMKQTVVPNRNMIMLSIATGAAVAIGAQYVSTAVHAGDHAIYPDCRPEFIRSFSDAAALANQGFGHFRGALVPFIYSSKADIAFEALQMGVQLDKTWSCYVGGENHCGRCGTCVERLEAIDEARNRFGNVYDYVPEDYTVYEDTEFWKATVKH